MIYLDHAATTPVPRPVADAMYQVLTEQFGNPSSQYPLGREAKALVEEGRAVVAGALGCRPENLHFTSCGTESDNWAISAAVWQGRHTGRHIITTAVEHSAVLEPCKLLQQQGYEVTYLAPDKTGHVTAEQVAQALREDTVLVSMMLVNNETGCIFPVQEVARLLREKNSRALLHCDAVQGFLKVPCDPVGWGVDLMSLSAHKIGGPKGAGALYTAPELRNLRPLLPGGGQEGGLRSGTEATAQIAAFAAATRLGRQTLEEDMAHMARLKEETVRRLAAEVPKAKLLVQGGAPHILAISLVGYKSEVVVRFLSDRGIYISSGSACHKGKSSHVFAALKLPKGERDGALRISFSYDTKEEDVDALIGGLKEASAQLFPSLS